ncbi:MAG: Smr/MutS family protein [Legionellales bacterium]|nr:Smr/MutS family protein [Legionellales bacterium]
MTKKPRIPQDDIDLFRQSMRDVKPIQHQQARIKRPRHTQPRASLPEPLTEIILERNTSLPRVDSESELFFARPDLPHKRIQQLRRGQLPIQACLDLHGFTVQQAEQAVGHFLLDCQAQAFYHVLIIHGKSSLKDTQPILKNYCNQWLCLHPLVLAFCSAKPTEGGRGAVYVLLRKARKANCQTD